MSYAHVDSVDALREFRSALWKFVEAANQSLSEADSELQRTLNWLEHDARTYWQGQIKQRTQVLNVARESLRAKLSITRRDGSKPSAVEEQKAVTLAQARLQRAQEKLDKVRSYARIFQKEALAYRGLMQRFVNAVQVDVPDAVAHLDALVGSLEQYTAIEHAASTAAVSAVEPAAASMRRPEQVEAGGRSGLQADAPARSAGSDRSAAWEPPTAGDRPAAPAEGSDEGEARPPEER